MLNQFLSFLSRFTNGSSPATPRAELEVIPREQHSISRKDISRAALDVLYGLHKAGYEAYLVGGCLRDMLTGGHPKDFDVTTNATPEEVKDVFRRARLIGRRFKIVHVRFGREVIEVATFRALHEAGSSDDDARQSESGMLLRDNVYGTIEEDALRRDFTINALYYNIADFGLYDFVDSLRDIEARNIRLIGDPEQRYREDPVRMLRAARFAAKLGFHIDPASEKPIFELGELIHQVPPARLFDEMLKLFMTGYGLASLREIQRLDLFRVLFPDTARLLDEDDSGWIQGLLEAAMVNTDRRLAQDKPVTPAFLFAILLWPQITEITARHQANGMPAAQALHKAAGQALSRQTQIITIPKRFSTVMREIWELQTRLPKRKGKNAERLVNHPRFRAAYDFLLRREEAGEIEPGLGEWWTQYQDADAEEREAMTAKLGGSKRGGRRRRRKPRS